MKNTIKITQIALILFLLVSCENDTNPAINNEVSNEKKLNIESFKSSNIDIELFKVPKKGSFGCKTGFGFCFRIVIIIFNQPEFKHDELEYDFEQETTNFMFKKTSENKGKLIFSSQIIESKYHNLDDFKFFEVYEDTNYGDVTFIKGKYLLEIDEKTNNLTYNIDVIYE